MAQVAKPLHGTVIVRAAATVKMVVAAAARRGTQRSTMLEGRLPAALTAAAAVRMMLIGGSTGVLLMSSVVLLHFGVIVPGTCRRPCRRPLMGDGAVATDSSGVSIRFVCVVICTGLLVLWGIKTFKTSVR